MGRPTIAEVRARGLAFANTLRQIATILGCPADADPLTDLDGLVMMVRGLAERVVGVEARIADAVAADRMAIGAWIRALTGSGSLAGLARSIEHGDHIDDDAPPLPSLRMTLLLRDELHKQVETLTAERDAVSSVLDDANYPHADGQTLADRVRALSAECTTAIGERRKIADERNRATAERDRLAADLDGEVCGLLADLCDLLFDDEERAAIHAYDGVIERAREVLADRDRRIDPVEHARAVRDCFVACFAGALMEYGSPLPQARMLAGGLWLESAERAALLTRVGADVLAEVER